MDWKGKLQVHEEAGDWREAISLLNSELEMQMDRNKILRLNYLLMDALVEREYSPEEFDNYSKMIKKYYRLSYGEFCEDPYYLFFTGLTAHISEWYFEIELEEAKFMLQKAAEAIPTDNLFLWGYWSYCATGVADREKNLVSAARAFLHDHISVEKTLSLGSLGQYTLEAVNYTLTKYAVD
jgi:tetratricopeptide (TPR) repeat protein